MMFITKATMFLAFSIFFIMAMPAYCHGSRYASESSFTSEQDETDLSSRIESLEEKMAQMIEGVEDERIEIQPIEVGQKRIGIYTTNQFRPVVKEPQFKQEVFGLESYYGAPYLVECKRDGRVIDNLQLTTSEKTVLTETQSQPCDDVYNLPDYRLLSSGKLRMIANSMLPRSDQVFEELDITHLSKAERVFFGAMQQAWGSSSYVFVPPNVNTYFMGVDCSGHVFKSGGYRNINLLNHHHSEIQLIERCPGTKVYWSTQTPSVSGVEQLIKHGTITTIYVGSLFLDRTREKYIDYTTVTNEQKKELYKDRAISCLALLHLNGVELKPWNWRLFETQSQISNPVGKNTINTILKCSEFDQQTRVITQYIKLARLRAVAYQENPLALQYECTKVCKWSPQDNTRECYATNPV